MKFPEWVNVGKNCMIEKNVVMGYKPARKIASLETVVGDNAKIRSGTIIYAGTKIGSGLETGHNIVIREENVIGNNFNIWTNSIVDYGCKIGNGVKIHSNCYIAQFTTLEDDVFFAPGVIVANDMYPGTKIGKDAMKGPTVKRGAQIGCNVTLLPAVTIGERTLVGAGSVVTKSVPKEVVVFGNPARIAKSIHDLEGGPYER